MTAATEVPCPAIEDALWAQARGSYPGEAALLLLTHHDHWLRSYAFRRRFVWLADGWDTGWRRAGIDWDAVGAELRDGPADSVPDDQLLGGSGSERRVLSLCASIGGDVPVDVAECVSGLDERNMRLVLAAVAHCAGGFDRPSLFPWPVNP